MGKKFQNLYVSVSLLILVKCKPKFKEIKQFFWDEFRKRTPLNWQHKNLHENS